MSFSDECRREFLTEDYPKSACCRRALAHGLLFASQMDSIHGVFYLHLPVTISVQEVAEVLHAVKGKILSSEQRTVAGRSFLEIRFGSQSTVALFQTALMSDLPLKQLMCFRCEQCACSFLRGVLSGSLSVADPKKTHHLELNIRDEETAIRIRAMTEDAGIVLRRIKRGDEVHLYTKNSAVMEDLFSFVRANKALFQLINTKIECDIRNNENRATNCVTRNIGRAVTASSLHMTAIEQLRSDISWEMLPESLRQTALLRLENPDATLSELAKMHNPPISKSGINHRLKKIAEIADQLMQMPEVREGKASSVHPEITEGKP